MSGALDTKMRATAERLLKKFGKVATYKKITQGTYDPTTGGITNTETDYAVTIYIQSPESGDIQSGIANASDIVALVSAKELGVEVAQGDKIIAGGTYEVKVNKPVWSGEQIALHQIICKAN